jgi:hypothetical protein
MSNLCRYLWWWCDVLQSEILLTWWSWLLLWNPELLLGLPLPTWWIYRLLPTYRHVLWAMTCAISLPCPNPIVQRATMVGLAGFLLLVRVVGMQIFGKPRIFGRCLLHLRLLLISRILLEKLWLLWLCYLHDGHRLLRGCPLIWLALPMGWRIIVTRQLCFAFLVQLSL